MTTVGAFEAKTHLSQLLDRVSRGEEITITKHGLPVAMLVPVSSSKQRNIDAVIEEILVFRQQHPLRGLKIRDMIEEGRRR